MVMRAEHATSPLGCAPAEETRRRGGKMVRGVGGGGGWEEECSTTCCCWTWHTEPASVGGAL